MNLIDPLCAKILSFLLQIKQVLELRITQTKPNLGAIVCR